MRTNRVNREIAPGPRGQAVRGVDDQTAGDARVVELLSAPAVAGVLIERSVIVMTAVAAVTITSTSSPEDRLASRSRSRRRRPGRS